MTDIVLVADSRSSDCAARHSFKIVQMPGNLLEVTGLATAPAMHKAGLTVNIIVRVQSRREVLMYQSPFVPRLLVV